MGQVAAKPIHIQEAVDYIRAYVKDVFSAKAAKNLRVLYGGDVAPEVVQGILSVPGVDGFLVGHSSLNYETFAGIVEATYRWQRNNDGGDQAPGGAWHKGE